MVCAFMCSSELDAENNFPLYCICLAEFTDALNIILCSLNLITNGYMFCRDLQSYLSHLNLFLASESGNFYILVDNRPWLKDLVSRSTHWWQLMVTKVA